MVAGAAGTLVNDGSITGSAGVFLKAGGIITNYGRVTGTGFNAIALTAGGNVTNASGAALVGYTGGIYVGPNVAGTITNSGSISQTATSGYGIELLFGGIVTNSAGASISGTAFGVLVKGGPATLTTAGTISGGTYAVDFENSAINLLVVQPSAAFVGGVFGGSGTTNTLELASGTGAIGGIGTGSITNFQTLTVDAGADWTLTGTNTIANVIANGTVAVSGSFDVSGAIDPSSVGVLKLDAGAILEVAAALGTATQMLFQPSSELILDSADLFGVNVGSLNYAGPQLQGFDFGDIIDIKNFAAAGATYTFNASSGLLQVSNDVGQTASLGFQISSLGSGSFQVTGDGATGIFITRN